MAQEKKSRKGQSDRNKEQSDLFEAVIKVKRCAAVVKGGRRFSFNALVVVGDRKGRVSFGYGKAKEVPPAVDKAVKQAQKSMKPVALNGGTIPHRTIGRFGASSVIMIPAAAGTGVIAGPGVREVMIAAGITDILTKSTGSTNSMNVVRAALNGLNGLRTKDQIAEMRGVII